MTDFTPTQRTKLNRRPARGHYDSETVFRILDEAFICHVGFAAEGQPYVIPTAFGRVDRTLYLHGSAVSRMLRTLAQGVQVCVTVTLVDGLVFARSAFHNSINYRSVVILGRALLVESSEEKWQALETFSEHVMPGRWKDIRPPNEQELKGTSVLRLPLEEVSAKVRSGPPIDDEQDYALPIWAGVLPLALTSSAPVTDERVTPGTLIPAYVRDYSRRKI
ncbi:MAG TPA: pyridoxamine 5'-phosphate oxidase family protein [Verrucomicrobiae bacterium]|nr:pyridoxamine 5'-phosphate oxidase family protein [Verrucomicrobiae bacterium]